MTPQTPSLPRHVWIYWHQGEEQAPELVRRCIASWRDRNPGWQVHVLDRTSLARFSDLPDRIDLARSDLQLQMIADLAHTHLLEVHGGVWADATLYCAIPLDNWIDEAAKSGCFAFSRPGADRDIAVWFLASTPGNALISGWCRRFTSVFEWPHYPRQQTFGGKLIYKVLRHPLGFNTSVTRLWFKPVLRRITGIYPYFSLAYKFSETIREDPAAAAIFAAMPVRTAALPHRIKHASKSAEFTPELAAFIASEQSPVHKLRWKADMKSGYWQQVFAALGS